MTESADADPPDPERRANPGGERASRFGAAGTRVATLARGVDRRVAVAAVAAVAALAVVIALVAGGGGGGGGEDAFRTQAQRICTQATRDVAALPDPQSLAELASISRKAARITGRTRAALAALDAPASSSADVDELLRSLARQQRLARELARSADHRSRAGIRKLIARGRREDATTGQRAQVLGLDACAAAR